MISTLSADSTPANESSGNIKKRPNKSNTELIIIKRDFDLKYEKTALRMSATKMVVCESTTAKENIKYLFFKNRIEKRMITDAK